MSHEHYSRERRRLLRATAWNGWAARKGYSATAGATRRQQLIALVELRRHRAQGRTP